MAGTERMRDGNGMVARQFAMRRTCAECPWRLDVAPGKFPPERFRALRRTCEPGGLHPAFACHMTPEGEEKACAGFLIVHGADSNLVRIAMIEGRVRLDEIEAAAPLHGSFAEMARANGYDPDEDADWEPGPDPFLEAAGHAIARDKEPGRAD